MLLLFNKLNYIKTINIFEVKSYAFLALYIQQSEVDKCKIS
jgi:hypothetical protein